MLPKFTQPILDSFHMTNLVHPFTVNPRCFLVQVCLSVRDFVRARDSLGVAQTELRALQMRPHFRNWFVGVLAAWIGVMATKVSAIRPI